MHSVIYKKQLLANSAASTPLDADLYVQIFDDAVNISGRVAEALLAMVPGPAGASGHIVGEAPYQLANGVVFALHDDSPGEGRWMLEFFVPNGQDIAAGLASIPDMLAKAKVDPEALQGLRGALSHVREENQSILERLERARANLRYGHGRF